MYEGTKCSFLEIIFKDINYFVVCIAGLLFFIGWWLIVDANAQYAAIFNVCQVYHLPGVSATVALVSKLLKKITFLFFFLQICTNIVPMELIYHSSSYSNKTCCTPCVAKICLFLFLMISFGSLISAFFILINDFILDQLTAQWPGYAICLQNVFIFTSSFLLRFGRKKDMAGLV